MLSNPLKDPKRQDGIKPVLQGYSAAFKAGIYIHWPFCARKCPYCDFNSHVRTSIDQAAWRTALVQEIKSLHRHFPGLTISSVFFGGGTPSLMPVETCAAVLEALDTCFGLAPSIEITLEANPSSVEADRFRGYRAAGVNRLSMGFQSLRDDHLRFLGRLHSADDARQALGVARSVFDSVSFDLIYALPDQTLSAWQQELSEALSFGPDHLSLYQLTIEEGTAFYQQAKRGDLVIPDEEHAADLYTLTDAMTRDAGLPRYEVSNHAVPGRESQHNLGYWRGSFYAGIGPGAHGRLPASTGSSTGASEAAWATSQIRRPEDWLQEVIQSGWGGSALTPLAAKERAEEQVMMGLRLSEGILIEPLSAVLDTQKISDLQQAGLLATEQGRLKTAGDGHLLINRLVAEILR